jgi:GNAT superfamily N-acetyltransferase
MNIEEVDARAASEETLLRIAEIQRACSQEKELGLPLPRLEDLVAFHRHPPGPNPRRHWVAEGGFAMLAVHGPRAAFVQLCVHPERRRRGLGSALLAAVVEQAPRHGVEAALHADHSSPEGAAFAAHHGFVDEQRIVRSLLDLRAAELPEPELPDGFVLSTWLDRVPDEHLAAYVRGRASMDDAPDPEGVELPTTTAEQVRAWEEASARRGREMRVTVVRGADGEVASFTDLRLPRGATMCATDDTGTVAAHRGKGLARAVKLESLRRLRDDHPEVAVVTTQNAEENAAMLHVNESLGFRRALVITMSALQLAPAGRGAGPVSGQGR